MPTRDQAKRELLQRFFPEVLEIMPIDENVWEVGDVAPTEKYLGESWQDSWWESMLQMLGRLSGEWWVLRYALRMSALELVWHAMGRKTSMEELRRRWEAPLYMLDDGVLDLANVHFPQGTLVWGSSGDHRGCGDLCRWIIKRGRLLTPTRVVAVFTTTTSHRAAERKLRKALERTIAGEQILAAAKAAAESYGNREPSGPLDGTGF